MYLDTADRFEIKELMKWGVFEGVTTNPSILKKENKNRSLLLNAIVQDGKTNNIFVQLVGNTVEELYEDFEKIKKLNKSNLYIVKVPINKAGIQAIKKIKKKFPEQRVLGTVIYSTEQSILGILAGCDYLAPYVDRMQRNGIDPYKVISQTREIINGKNEKTKIMAASFKSTNQVVEALVAGSHTVTVSPNIAKKMLLHELVEKDIEVFNKDAQGSNGKLNK